MRWAIVLSALLLSSAAMADFNLDEIEQLDKLEQQDLLGAARKAAKAWDFDTAERYLAQARQKGQTDADLKVVATLIADNRAAKLAKEQQEAAEAQASAAAAHRPAASAGSASGVSGGSTPQAQFVSVEVDPTCALEHAFSCNAQDLKLSGGSNQFSDISVGGRGAIYKGYDGKLAGQYNYSVRLEQGDEQKVCSGSFSVDGTKRDMIIHIMYSDCQANVNGF
jgi:hypothetical protein